MTEININLVQGRPNMLNSENTTQSTDPRIIPELEEIKVMESRLIMRSLRGWWGRYEC